MYYHNLKPEVFSIGSLQVRWYGLFYVISFIIGYIFVKKNLKRKGVSITAEQYDTMFFNIMLGVIIGGRLGYILFYNLSEYIASPLKIFAFWEGGMSFHGGVIAVLLFGYAFVRRNKLSFYPLADAVSPYAALGLGLGRIGNFINGELYGRVTSVPWAVIFPYSDGQPRHPSQLYQAFTEGLLLFIILQIVYRKTNKEGIVIWLFVGLYGLFRFIIEFFREPDEQIGYLLLNLSLGQILCLLMIIGGAVGLAFVLKPRKVIR
ncbi:MAG: prolipoprotein diacylglyceryl transferase [Candidatus Cloacimonas sp.]|nr:prolipoprotein diacylglyceryl transferase [Candidatus Cloacimonadota bacterium]